MRRKARTDDSGDERGVWNWIKQESQGVNCVKAWMP